MVKQSEWIERKFDFSSLNPGIFPCIVERLRGTPDRLEASLRNISEEKLKVHPGGRWSLKEEAGHLYDLEELWEERLEGLLSDDPEIIPADMTNRKTHEADHNSKDLNVILSDFRNAREKFVNKLDNLNEEQVELYAIHPRLKEKMRIIDLAFFVAEHDDHHLAVITSKKNL